MKLSTDKLVHSKSKAPWGRAKSPGSTRANNLKRSLIPRRMKQIRLIPLTLLALLLYWLPLHARRDSGKPPTRKFKVFVYDLPDVRCCCAKSHGLNAELTRQKFSTRLLSKPHYFGGNCDANMYAAEVFLHKAILNSSFVTHSPDDATLFFIPFYQACYIHSADNSTKSVDDALFHVWNLVRTEWSHWNASHGRNHFWILTHDRGMHTLFSNTNLAIWDTKKDILNSFALTVTSQTDWFFRPGWDIAIPPFTEAGFLSYKGVERVYPENRTVFASFKGVIPPTQHWSYSNGIRQHLFATRYSTNFSVYGAWGGLGDDDPRNWSYGDYMVNSVFCLCPPGLVAWTPRVVNAVVSGCIPVIVSDAYYLPFRNLLDYSQFSIHVAEKDVGTIKERLDAIPLKKVREMQSELKNVYKNLIYERDGNGTIAILDMVEQELLARSTLLLS